MLARSFARVIFTRDDTGLGLGISRSRLFLRSRDQDLSHLVSRPRPRPSGLKSKTLAFRSRVNSSLRPYRSRDHKSAFCLKFTIRSNSPTFQTEFHGNSREFPTRS